MEDGAYAYVGWEEAPEKGARREVRFYLRRKGDGAKVLAVVGRERSLRHMSYYLVLEEGGCCVRPLGGFKSRREVVDWLNAVVSGHPSQRHHNSSSGSEDAQCWAIGSKRLLVFLGWNLSLKEPQKEGKRWGIDNQIEFTTGCMYFSLDTLSYKLEGRCTDEIIWLGSPSIDRRKRKHFPSFCRKGAKISVHDFVYILAEEGKRLVAYLDDMYEDSKANKVVVVRWFHKADEVAIGLHDSLSDKEIFFSRCLQDLSFECIDGLATVLCPEHFEKFRNEADCPSREIFVCRNLFEEDDVRPFDITEVDGYWRQELVRRLYPFTLSKRIFKIEQTVVSHEVRQNFDDGLGLRPRKKQREYEEDTPAKIQRMKESSDEKNKFKQNPSFPFPIGSAVEVLSQDSGVRGCWFRASIINIYKDRVKVRYWDIQDAIDEAKNLEEWVLSSRVADPDNYEIYSRSRRMIRPVPEISSCEPPQTFNVGTLVDVLWHDGRWEGIVVRKEGEDKFLVYFPGEKKDEVFSHENLRHTQEWVENRWIPVKERLDLVNMILTLMGLMQDKADHEDEVNQLAAVCSNLPREVYPEENLHLRFASAQTKAEVLRGWLDLSKDYFLSQLKWKVSRKRSRSSGSSSQKAHCEDDPSSSPESRPPNHAKFFIKSSLKADHENCKFIGDSVFGPSGVPALTSLVMSR